ncbi:MAG: hypothetical protein AAFY56_10605 [Pseudomonadota bacterium]
MRSMLAVLIVLVSATWARAEDPIGRWQLDREAFESQLASLMESQLGNFDNLPEGTKVQMQAMMKSIMAEATAGLDGVAEFRDDGTLVFTDADGNTDTGSWVQEGDTVIIIPENAPRGQERIQGTLSGDVITVKSDMSDAPSDAPEMTMTFNRVN